MKPKNFVFIVFIIILSSSKCGNKGDSKTFTDDTCPLSYKVEWTIVETGVSVDKQIELLSKLAAAAEADASKINKVIGSAKGSAKIEGSFELSKAVQSESIRKAEVSQDVFDEYVKVRTSSCNIWDAIMKGFYGNDVEALKKSERLIHRDTKEFCCTRRKKKEPKLIIDAIANDTIYFSISNYLGDNLKLTITQIEVAGMYRKPGSLQSMEEERYLLPSIIMAKDKMKYDLLNHKNVLKIPANDVASFYFGINFPEYAKLKIYGQIKIDLNVTYISPSSGEKGLLFSEFYRLSKPDSIQYKF